MCIASIQLFKCVPHGGARGKIKSDFSDFYFKASLVSSTTTKI